MNDGRIFVAEITVVVDDIGTEQTFYFSTLHLTTKPSDTPANTPISAYLKNPGTYKADLFSKGRVTGLVQPNYGIMTLANPLDSTGKGVFDDWASYGVGNGRVVLRMGYETDAYPNSWTIVYIARVYKVSVTNDEVSIALRDRSQLFDKPVNGNVFLGTGGKEGNGAGLGRKKQSVFGDPGFHPAICINVQKQIYYVSNNGCDTWSADEGLLSPYNGSQEYTSPFDVYDNAYKLLRVSNYSTFEQLESNVPDDGEVAFWFGGTSAYSSYWYKGPVYFRLGSPPAGEIRVFGAGYPNENDNINYGGLIGQIFLESLAMRTGLVYPDDFHSNTYWNTPIGSQLVEEDESYLQVMSNACLQFNSWFGFTKKDVFVSGIVADPESTNAWYGIKTPEYPDGLPGHYDTEDTISIFTFTDDYIKNLRSDAVNGQETPMWATVFNSGKTWPVSNIAGGASNKHRDYMTRQPYYDSFKAYSDFTKIKHPNAETIEVYIPTRSLINDFSRHMYSARFMWLYAGTPRTYTFTTDLLPELLDIELNDVVTLKTSRFGLSAGVKMRVIGITINTQTREMEFILWINGRGVWTGSTSPLDPGTEAYDDNEKTKKLIGKLGKVYWPEWRIYSTGGLGIGSGTGGSFLTIPEWDLITSGSLEQPDPDFASVVLLMHMENDSPWEDHSSYAATLTASGTITASGTSPLVGSKSMVPGTNGKVNTPTNVRYNMGTGHITIECIIRISATPNFERIFEIGGVGAQIWFNGSTLSPSVIVGGSVIFTGTALPTNTTGHLALVKTGTSSPYTWTLYWQGSSIGSGTATTTDDGSTNRVIAVGNFDSAGQPFVSGKIDEFRVTKGVARYTGAFTPPSTPFPNF